MKGKVTILGCGNSTGVPAIGNYWGDCDPCEPKNMRMRSSVLVQCADTSVIVDTGPDFRQQLNQVNISYLDAVLYSHAHADHINGIDDLRFLALNNNRHIPVYANHETLVDLTTRFYYLFEGGNHRLYPQVIEGLEINPSQFGKAQIIRDLSFTPFEQDHGTCTSLGYKFGDIAYSVDMFRLSDAAVDILKGIKIWIVDAAAYKSETNPVHANLNTIFALNDRIKAEKVYLSSLSLAMDYKTLVDELPDGYMPAHDGLVLDFSD